MGARIWQNPRTKYLGTVDQYPWLSIADLRRRGVIPRGGKTTLRWGHGESLLTVEAAVRFDLRVELEDARDDAREARRYGFDFLDSQPIPSLAAIAAQPEAEVLFKVGMREQTVRLMSRRTPLGGVDWLFICPITTATCRKLYYVTGRFGSREGQRLSYASRSLGAVDRRVRKKARLERALAGGGARGKPRGRRREALESQLALVERELGLVGEALARNISHWKERRTERRARFEERVTNFQQAFRQLDARALETAGLATWSAATCRKIRELEPVGRARTPPIASFEGLPVLDSNILRRLGFLADGALRGGWLETKGPVRDEHLMLVDTRFGAPRLLLLSQDGTARQAFVMAKVTGDFGKLEWAFVSPTTKIATRVLVYRGGKYAPLEGDKDEAVIDWGVPMAERGLALPDLLPKA